MYSTDLRKAALRLHQIQHISFRGISSLLGMAASTVCRWVQNVQPKGWPRTGNRKFSDEMRTFVTEMIRRRPCKKPVTDEVAGVGKFTVPAVVKMKLATFVKDDGVLKYILTLPPLVNRLEGEAYAFGNFYLLRLMNDANAELPVIDHKFYNKCIIAVATNNARDSTLTQSWRDAIVAFDLHRPLDGRPKVDITGSIFNQIVGTLSKKMATMATNHLTMNLAPRLWVYLGWKYPHLKKLRRLIVNVVLSNPTEPLDKTFPPKSDGPNTNTAHLAGNAKLAEAKDVAQGFRDIMPLKGITQYASRAHHTLRFYHHILTETEIAMENQEREEGRPLTSKDSGKKMPKRIRFKPFTMLPTKAGFTISYASISSAAFINILKKLGKVDAPSDGRGLDHEAKRKIWARFCNLNAVETCSRVFNCSIVTDGCGVSILMAKCSCIICPKTSDETLAEARQHMDAHMVGVDPGFTDVVTVVSKDGTVQSYSSSKYYEQSKVTLSRRRTAKWNEDTASLAASIPSPRTADADKMAAHLKAYLRELPSLIDHRMAKGYRNMRFMRFKFKQKAIHEICDMMTPMSKDKEDRHTTVFFGDWNGGKGTPISRRACGPLQEIKMHLRSRTDVSLIDVDEFRTSANCSRCFEKLVNMKAPTTSKVKWREGARVVTELQNQRIHKCLHCKNSECCKASNKTTWNRDVNAAKNIFMMGMLMLKGWKRPPSFLRMSTC